MKKEKAKHILILGAGELGLGLVRAYHELGCRVSVVDRYEGAPAMIAADDYTVADYTDYQTLSGLLDTLNPDLVVPEIEGLNIDALRDWEYSDRVVPSVDTLYRTMDRQRLRELIATTGVKVLPHAFADNFKDFEKAVAEIGIPCVVKPCVSSSGRGQYVLNDQSELFDAWMCATRNGRLRTDRVMVEQFLDFDMEVTILAVRTGGKYINQCRPIGQRQEGGDYRESWQPAHIEPTPAFKVIEVAHKVVSALSGNGVYGVELFIRGDEVFFNEVSPRPHDTGMVTMVSQNVDEFEMHAMASLGMTIPFQHMEWGFGASRALVAEGRGRTITIDGLDRIDSRTRPFVFVKPGVDGHRRVGVIMTEGYDVDECRARLNDDMAKITIRVK